MRWILRLVVTGQAYMGSSKYRDAARAGLGVAGVVGTATGIIIVGGPVTLIASVTMAGLGAWSAYEGVQQVLNAKEEQPLNGLRLALETGLVLLPLGSGKLINLGWKVFGKLPAHRVEAAVRVPWSKDIYSIKAQGFAFENHVTNPMPEGVSLPKNFKTFDAFYRDTGHAISVKTLNTSTPAKGQKPEQIYYSLKKNIDDTKKFTTPYGKAPNDIKPHEIKSREVRLAVRHRMKFSQWKQIKRGKEHADQEDVGLIITVVK
jgi:hypothetical protein